jgi:hypothetical protein
MYDVSTVENILDELETVSSKSYIIDEQVTFCYTLKYSCLRLLWTIRKKNSLFMSFFEITRQIRDMVNIWKNSLFLQTQRCAYEEAVICAETQDNTRIRNPK